MCKSSEQGHVLEKTTHKCSATLTRATGVAFVKSTSALVCLLAFWLSDPRARPCSLVRLWRCLNSRRARTISPTVLWHLFPTMHVWIRCVAVVRRVCLSSCADEGVWSDGYRVIDHTTMVSWSTWVAILSRCQSMVPRLHDLRFPFESAIKLSRYSLAQSRLSVGSDVTVHLFRPSKA